MNHHSSTDQFDNLLNESVENSSATESYWNNQSEEVFLQNLFANTLLTDGFNVDDNLDLSYGSNLRVASHEPLTSHQGLETSNIIIPSIGKNINTLVTDSFVEGTKNLDETGLGIDPMTDFVLNLDASYNLGEQLSYNLNLNAIEPSSFLLKETSSSQPQIDPLASPLQGLVLNNNKNNLFSLDDNSQVLDPSIQLLSAKNDEIFFKKPIPISSTNYLNSYIDSVGTRRQNISTVDSTIKNESNKKGEKTLNDLNYGGSKLVHDQKVENDVSNGSVEQDIASNDNNELLVNISSLSSSPSTSSNMTNGCFSTSPSTNKLFTLKRSRKRSKLLSNTSPSTMSKLNNLNSNSSVSQEISQKLTASKQAKLYGSKKMNKKEKKDKTSGKQQQQPANQQTIRKETIFSSNLEPLSKKFAIDTASKSKGDVELHIKELSLLDLHSSEDDSSERIAKPQINDLKIDKFDFNTDSIKCKTHSRGVKITLKLDD